MNRDELMLEIEKIRAKESSVISVILGKTLSKKFPFKLSLFLLNLVVVFYGIHTGSPFKIIASIFSLELVITFSFYLYMEIAIYSKLRMMIVDYINRSYYGTCRIEFPSALRASVLLFKKGPRDGTALVESVDINMNDISINSYINVLLILEDNLGIKNEK